MVWEVLSAWTSESFKVWDIMRRRWRKRKSDFKWVQAEIRKCRKFISLSRAKLEFMRVLVCIQRSLP